jgi:penicillin amidase
MLESGGLVNPPEVLNPAWDQTVNSLSLPAVLNPSEGYVASANNKPPAGDVPVGFVFSTNDRINRISELMQEKAKYSLQDIKEMQQDVYMASSVELRDALIKSLDKHGLGSNRPASQQRVIEAMREWDGYYRVDSVGAWAYELFRREYALALYAPASRRTHSRLTNIIGIEVRMLRDLRQDDQDPLVRALESALVSSARDFPNYENWGEAHKLTMSHPFSRIPVVGHRFRFGEYPMGGSVQTLLKSGHNPLADDFSPYHGATARFVADLSDPNANYGVLVSGQDGWFNSANFLDQTPLFLKGEYIQMPMDVEKVRDNAVVVHRMGPSN